MTKEQEEAIKILSDSNILFNIQRDTALSIRVAIETVLNMLKEKDKKIEYYKKQKDYDMQFRHELLEQIRCFNLDKDHNSAEIEQKNTELAEKSAEIEKKDRIIDLMAKYINYLSDELVQTTGKNELEFCRRKSCKDSNYSCEQCIKKYFERKSKK